MSLQVLKEQFGCCVKLLRMISEEEKLEAIKHIQELLTEFDFRDSSSSCKELNNNEYVEGHIKEENEEDVKPDTSKLIDSSNHFVKVETVEKRKREMSSIESSYISPKRPSLKGIKIFSNAMEGGVKQPGAGIAAARANHQASSHNVGDVVGKTYDGHRGWKHRQERNNVWGDKWRVGEEWSERFVGEGDCHFQGLGRGKQFYADDAKQHERHSEVERELQEKKVNLGTRQGLGSMSRKLTVLALNQRVLDIKGKEMSVFSRSYDVQGILWITCNVCYITTRLNNMKKCHMVGRKHLKTLEEFTVN